MVSALFSRYNVTQFEFNIRECLTAFVGQFDRLAADAVDKARGGNGQKYDAKAAWVQMDVLSWFNYLAFDIIGDLAFGSPFGMIKAGRDVAHVAVDHNAAFGGQGLSHAREKTEFIEVPAIEILNKRGEFSAFLGVLRPWMRYIYSIQHPPKMANIPTRPYVRRLPGMSAGGEAVKNMDGVCPSMRECLRLSSYMFADGDCRSFEAPGRIP